MKIFKESLLMNDLKTVLDAIEETTLIMRREKEPIVMMTLKEYNQMKEKLYKKK